MIGACILPPRIFPDDSPDPEQEWQDQLTDSKKLTKKHREELEPLILRYAATGLGWVYASEIDEIGLGQALRLATRRAVKQLKQAAKEPISTIKNLAPSNSRPSTFTEIIIDGTVNFLADTPLENYVTTMKKADLLIKEVSAASIIAKVARDRYMVNLAKQYPSYGFENHVGYGTAAHRAALQKLGPCPEHRSSFRPIQQFKKNTTEIGNHAEAVVANYLAANGHHILERNHKTKFYEIDIVSTKDDIVYFTEVKYRSNIQNGTPLEAITPKKQLQMRHAAEAFLEYRPSLRNHLQPQLAAAAVSGPDFHLDTWMTLD